MKFGAAAIGLTLFILVWVIIFGIGIYRRIRGKKLVDRDAP